MLINHTYDHSSFTGLSTDGKAMPQAQRWSQLDRTEQILRGFHRAHWTAGRATWP